MECNLNVLSYTWCILFSMLCDFLILACNYVNGVGLKVCYTIQTYYTNELYGLLS